MELAVMERASLRVRTKKYWLAVAAPRSRPWQMSPDARQKCGGTNRCGGATNLTLTPCKHTPSHGHVRPRPRALTRLRLRGGATIPSHSSQCHTLLTVNVLARCALQLCTILTRKTLTCNSQALPEDRKLMGQRSRGCRWFNRPCR